MAFLFILLNNELYVLMSINTILPEHRHARSLTHCLWLISRYINTVATEPNWLQSLKYLPVVPFQRSLPTPDLGHHLQALLNGPVIPRKAIFMGNDY